jgi:hypothetical protein
MFNIEFNVNIEHNGDARSVALESVATQPVFKLIQVDIFTQRHVFWLTPYPSFPRRWGDSEAWSVRAATSGAGFHAFTVE